MKLILSILPLCFALAYGQFGGFGSGFANTVNRGVAGTVNRGVGVLASGFKKVPAVNNVRDFSDFLVSNTQHNM